MKQIFQANQALGQNSSKVYAAIPKGSPQIVYEELNGQVTPKTLWTPQTDKSIYLTGVQACAPLGASIILSEENNDFLALNTTEAMNTVNRNFSAPYKLQPNASLRVRTADEQLKCNTSGATTATPEPIGNRNDFTDVNNALGLHNGTYATLSSILLIQAAGSIVLGYNLLPAMYDQLEIESVVLKFYFGITLGVALTTTVNLNWRPNPSASWILLQTIQVFVIGSVDYLTNPLQFDITTDVLAAPDPWNVISNLQTSFEGIHTSTLLGNTINLDAVEVEICTTGKNKITVVGYEM